MTRRLAALGLLLLAAVAIWLLAGEPARVRRDQARGEYARLREERERLRGRVAAAERSGRSRQPAAGSNAAGPLRSSLLAATRDLSLEAVRLQATARERQAVHGELSVEGRSEDVLTLAERLARPDSGVLLLKVAIVAAGVSDPGWVRLGISASAASAQR